MSPEQAWGRSIDHRTDIFSLGAVLYELLTGTRLFLDDSEITILEKVRSAQVPPLTEIRAEIPSELAGIVLRALAREPADRYATSGDMKRDLNAFLYSLSVEPAAYDLSLLMRDLFPDLYEAEMPFEMVEAPAPIAFEPPPAPPAAPPPEPPPVYEYPAPEPEPEPVYEEAATVMPAPLPMTSAEEEDAELAELLRPPKRGPGGKLLLVVFGIAVLVALIGGGIYAVVGGGFGPAPTPTPMPTPEPTAVEAALMPTAEPTATPSEVPTVTPTGAPTASPTAEPSSTATATPTEEPTSTPTITPTATLTPIAIGAFIEAPEVKPELVSREEPRYPAQARQNRWSGIVVLEVTVNEDGDVSDVKNLSTSGNAMAGFAEAAESAVRRWKFKPATHHGVRVSTSLRVSVPFQLRE